MWSPIRLLLVVPLFVGLTACSHFPEPQASAPPVEKIEESKAALRDLWVGHIFWIRSVAVATLRHDPEARKAAEEGVITNAEDLAGAIEPYYGKSASDRLFSLLADHYGGVREHLDATAAGNAGLQDLAARKLVANAAEIAEFLSVANPYLSKDELMGLLVAHAAQHMAQFQQLKNRAYAQEAETWRGMKQHIYVIADSLAVALAKQFPDKV